MIAVSPITIQILIECACSAEPGSGIQPDVWNSPAANDTLNWLASEGLIDHMNFAATARGKAWLSFICQTPLPEQTWVLPEREATLHDGNPPTNDMTALHDKGSEGQ